jgi:hypothetical protein
MQFSPASSHFIPLWSEYSPQHPVLKRQIEKMMMIELIIIIIIIIIIITIIDLITNRKKQGIESNK